jgi:alpha-ribazole phosphatase
MVEHLFPQTNPKKNQHTHTRLYLARHGVVENVDPPRFYGMTDAPISAQGKKQIEVMAQWFVGKRIDRIYSSTLSRSVESAHIIAKALNKNVISVEGLCEGNFGKWEGLTIEEVEKRYPEDYKKWITNYVSFRLPNGESLELFQNRILSELKILLETNKNNHLVLALHGGVNRIILCWALGIDMTNFYRIDQDYGCLNIIDVFDNCAVVKLINMTLNK